ncbi:MAG: hypothetical protein LLF86_09270 [Nitrospiraceae bacterium]|nr:hypothetical protein [Nitrospiraceae bacterium]
MQEPHIKIAEEQTTYAGVLDTGMKAGLLIIIFTFAVYVFNLLQPHIPNAEISRYWSLPVHQYLQATGVHAGWSWLHMLGKGDFLNFAGIAFLAGISIICYIRIMPVLIAKKDTAYTVIALLEILVLVLAASGVLRSGGH